MQLQFLQSDHHCERLTSQQIRHHCRAHAHNAKPDQRTHTERITDRDRQRTVSGLNEGRESDSDRLLEASFEEEDHAVEGTSGAEDIAMILDEPLAHVLVLHVGTELHVVLIQVVVGRHQQLEVVGQQLYWLSRRAYVHTQDAM